MNRNLETGVGGNLEVPSRGSVLSFLWRLLSSYRFMPLVLIVFSLFCVGFISLTLKKNKSTEMRPKATGPEQTAFSNGVQISPDRVVYEPGEQIAITVIGSGDIQDIKVRQAPSRRNIIQVPYVSSEISGTYDSVTKVWTGNWVLPENGEYVVMANLLQTNGQTCAGNPAYACTGCRTGTMVGILNGAQITPGVYPCNGHHKTVIINDGHEDVLGYDMKRYWNLNSGNYWMYAGENKKCGLRGNLHKCAPREGVFASRMAVEEKVDVCGHQFLPYRFTKTKPEGYHFANVEQNFRIFLSYYQSGERWSSSTIGRPLSKGYVWTESDVPLASLGAVGPTLATRSMSTDTKVDFENIYYSPHYFHDRFVQLGWQYEGIDKHYQDSMSVISSCNWPYKSNAQEGVRERYINNKLFEDNIRTPAYEGSVLRLRLIEAGYPVGSGWHIREDWYFAENIGRVRVDWKDCRASLLVNPNDSDCSTQSTVKMTNPDVSMSLANYYIGGALTTTVTPKATTGTGSWTLHVTTPQGKPYTGYLEAKNCISEINCLPGKSFKWGYGDGTYIWVEKGLAVVDMKKVVNHISGLRHAWFRPWVEKPPADAVGETVITNTELPWGNETRWRVTYSQSGGDNGSSNGDDLTIL